ncbi:MULTISPECIES: ribbon-helix-helix domain-containing protein [unclassified Niallia]|uniref:ribbon-helix-helix domain-containing protein n=1 Tax=unclassified Niallia TaxID=2837522 RepID=UPI0020421F4A|nr:ribbon-helix-helix domain-containing protein [Niallia sp. MER 6]MCM3030356.1 ribbon-helix-helix domain-containing protein [Niallia sp. MER 6]
MTEKRGLKNRKPLSNAVKIELYDALKNLSDETKIPMSKLLDEALEDLLKKYSNSAE